MFTGPLAESIGSSRLTGEPATVAECLEPPNLVDYNALLLPWVDFISEHDFVLVRNGSNPLSGIVTAADLSLEFGHFVRPYMLLNEIELRLRHMLASAITVDDMVVRLNGGSVKRKTGSVEDLTLYQLQCLMDDPDVWDGLGLGVSRPELIASLHNVRRVRNAIAHIDSRSPTDRQVDELDKFAKALRWLASTALRSQEAGMQELTRHIEE